MESNQHITLLPNYDNPEKNIKSKANGNVIRIGLPALHGENEAALLYVVPEREDKTKIEVEKELEGGEVKRHSHDADSEIYIKISDDNLVYDDYGYLVGFDEKPQIAGRNSPNGIVEHGINRSYQPQVYYAFKRGNAQGTWNDYSEQSLRAFMSSLNFAVGDWWDEKTGEKKGLEFNLFNNQGKQGLVPVVGVRIDYKTNQVIYVDRRNPERVVREETCLQELFHPQKDLGREM